jgi:hypothetical protein
MIFSLISHTTCQNSNCASQLTCILFLCKFLRVCQKSKTCKKYIVKHIHCSPVHVCVTKPYIGCPYSYPWVLGGMGAMLLFMGGHGWAWVRYYCSWVGIGFVHPCIQLQIGFKLLGCREYANQEALRAEAKTMNDLLFVRSNQNLV